MPDRPRTLTLENGKPPQPTFSDQEMSRRVAAMRQHMLAERVEAVILTSMHCVNYFTDFV